MENITIEDDQLETCPPTPTYDSTKNILPHEEVGSASTAEKKRKSGGSGGEDHNIIKKKKKDEHQEINMITLGNSTIGKMGKEKNMLINIKISNLKYMAYQTDEGRMNKVTLYSQAKVS